MSSPVVHIQDDPCQCEIEKKNINILDCLITLRIKYVSKRRVKNGLWGASGVCIIFLNENNVKMSIGYQIYCWA